METQDKSDNFLTRRNRLGARDAAGVRSHGSKRQAVVEQLKSRTLAWKTGC